MVEGSLDSGSDMRSVQASRRIGICAKRAEESWHKESRGRCLADLTTGRSHEVKWMVLEEPWRRKR